MAEGRYRWFESLTDEIPIPETGKANRVIHEDDSLKAVLFAFAPSHGLPEHKSPFPIVIQFLRGSARVTMGPDAVRAQEGSWFQVEPNLSHSILAEEPTVMLLLLLKSASPAPSGGQT